MLQIDTGDIVLYRLSPSGVEGVALLIEEGHSDDGRRMFAAAREVRSKIVIDTEVISLYAEDIIEVYAQGVVRCHACGNVWDAVWPEETRRLECPACGLDEGRTV